MDTIGGLVTLQGIQDLKQAPLWKLLVLFNRLLRGRVQGLQFFSLLQGPNPICFGLFRFVVNWIECAMRHDHLFVGLQVRVSRRNRKLDWLRTVNIYVESDTCLRDPN